MYDSDHVKRSGFSKNKKKPFGGKLFSRKKKELCLKKDGQTKLMSK